MEIATTVIVRSYCRQLRRALLAILCYLVVSANTWAQDTDTAKKAKLIDSVAGVNAQYIVDGKLSDTKADNIDPNDIISVTVLKKVANKNITGNRPAVIIVTKTYAIKEYQKKLSTFSKKYKGYLEQHQNSDADCGYILNGDFVLGTPNEQTRKLYEIPAEKIKGVGFKEYPSYNGGDSKKCLVHISTKK